MTAIDLDAIEANLLSRTRTPNVHETREMIAEVKQLREALAGLVDALPLCMHPTREPKGICRVRPALHEIWVEGFGYMELCDEHAAELRELGSRDV